MKTPMHPDKATPCGNAAQKSTPPTLPEVASDHQRSQVELVIVLACLNGARVTCAITLGSERLLLLDSRLVGVFDFLTSR